MDDACGKPVLGLVGGIGSGKSTVAKLLAGLGCAVIDADALSREAMEREEVKREIVAWWGSGIMGGDGRIDRKAVAAKVFGKPDELRRLEGLIHPLVHARRAEQRRAHGENPAVLAIVEDCPLLLECGLDQACDAVLFIDSARENRLKRVAAGRGWTPAELDRREANQWPLDKKAALADYVVQNDAGEAELLEALRRVLSTFVQDVAVRGA